MEHPGTTLSVPEESRHDHGKVKLLPWIKEIKGKVGDVVFRQSPSGETILSKAPDMSKVAWSPAQKEQRRRLKQAIAYAKAAMSDPDARAGVEWTR